MSSLVPRLPPRFPSLQYILQTIESWTEPGEWRLVISDSAYELTRQNRLHRSEEWLLSMPKWLKILIQHCVFVSEICTMMGSRFPRQLDLLVQAYTYDFTCIQSAHVHV